MHKVISLFFLSVLFLLLARAESFASSIMSNQDYTIESGKTSSPDTLLNLKKQFEKSSASIKKTGGENYTLQLGFSENGSKDAFSFAISHAAVNFGVLSATNPVTRKTALTILSPESGYQVFALENTPLLSSNNAIIPDTTCDNGSCSEVIPSTWDNTLTYGFGYQSEDQNAYKQFADSSRDEQMQPVILGAKIAKLEKNILYKINISGTQALTSYMNTITYIAAPEF